MAPDVAHPLRIDPIRISNSSQMTTDTVSRSRGLIGPSFAGNFPPSSNRGRRECRMRAAPAISCANSAKKVHTSIQGSGEHPTFPAQWFDGLSRAHPGVSGSSRLRRLRIAGSSAPGRADVPSADLTPTTEASGPHDFAVRFGIVRPARRAPLTETRPANTPRARRRSVHRIPSQRSVTMANAPSSGTGWHES